MIKETIWGGYWWLPNEPKVKIPGRLILSGQNPIKLELIGKLDIGVREDIVFINGFTDKGKKITLYNSYCSMHNMPNPGFETQDFVANFVFEGSHFKKIEELKFKKICFEFFNSNKWLEFREGLNSSRDAEKKTIILELGPSLNYKSSINDLKISLDIFYSVNRDYKIYKATASQKPIFTIEINRRTKFENILEHYIYLKNLLVLCNQVPILPKKIILITHKKGLKNSKKVNLFYSEKIEKKAFIEEQDNLPRNLIQGLDFQKNFNQIISNWFSKKEKIDFQVENYFSQYYFDAFLSDKLLTNVRLLESLHREFIDNNRNIHLKTRYKEILMRFKKQLKPELEIKNNLTWSIRLKDYRNQLAHNNRIIKTKSFQLKHIEKVTYESNLLIVSFLLNELGFSKPEIGEFVKRSFTRNRISKRKRK